MPSNIAGHSWLDLLGATYGTIGTHCTIHLQGQDQVTIDRVEDHCNISGTCKMLRIGALADHVFICSTGTVQVGAAGGECKITANASEADLEQWRKDNDRVGNPGN